jgi:uncharacterized membrane protein YccC
MRAAAFCEAFRPLTPNAAAMKAAQWMRGLVSSIVAFDRSSLEYGFAIRCTIGVAIPLVVACAIGHPSLGFAPAIGALIGGFTSLQGIYRSRIAVVIGVTLGISISSFLGALAAPSLPALIVLTVIVGYFYGTIAQFGVPAGVAALNTTVAFIIFSSLPLTPQQDLQQSSLLFLGGMIQAVLLILAWPLDRSTIERRGLANAYRELATYAGSLTSETAKAPPIAGLATARQIVADQQPLARSRDVARYKRILAEGEALRHRLGALATLEATDPASQVVRDLANGTAEQLSALAATLDGTMTQTQLEEVRTQTLGSLVAFERTFADDAFALALERDIAAHLRNATQAVAVAATGRPVRLFFSAVPRPSAYIQTKIDWFSRDAIRIAVTLGVAMLLGHTLFESSRGYWIALTAALVLRPDLQGTIVRGFARIAGTVLGAVIAMFIIIGVHGNPLWQSAIITGAAAVCYLMLIPNYALFSTAMTIFVIVALDLLGAGHTTVGDRVLDTLIGGALAIVAYAVFPTWALRRSRPLLADTIDAQRAFAVALLDAYADPLRIDPKDIATIRTRSWKIRTEVEAAIDAARAEPKRVHTIPIERALDILGAIQSFSLVSMALETGLETMPPGPATPEIMPFRNALDRTMREIASALLADRAPAADDSLDKAYQALSAMTTSDSHAGTRLIAEYGGGYVQSVAALAQGAEQSSRSSRSPA